MSLLKVTNLSIRFGGVHAVRDVSFSVEAGSFVGMMGPNGAGKTTVINGLSRVHQSEKGEALFEGQDLLKLKPHEITQVGISRTFQDLGFFNHISDMTVLDFVMLGQCNFKSIPFLRDGFRTSRSRNDEIILKHRARNILAFFREMRESLEPPQEDRGYPIIMGRGGFPDLIDVEDVSISGLSFAWRRRLDLARALVSQPKMIILDEPAQGLPPSEIGNLGELLKRIHSEFGVSAIVVEHNVEMLMNISDKIIVMNHGEKVAEGTSEEMSSNQKVNEIYLGSDPSSAISGEKLVIEAVPLKEKKEIPLLDVRNIDLFYGQAQALSSVSIKLFPGQLACVLGTNGSGKSSLLKAISGIERPNNGEIYLRDEYMPLGWPEVAVERGIQYVPQGHVIFPGLTVHQNLMLGAYTYKKRGKHYDIERVFHYFPQLKDMLQSQGNDLSGGQRQMLAIGQAIIGSPEILLLDEPSLGLSPRNVDLLFGIIDKIRREEKCSILLVEQNVMRSLEICDYVFMMSSGILISEGTTASYRDNLDVVKKNLGFL